MQLPNSGSTFGASMSTVQWITVIFLGLGLAASSGLNTFLPLLMLALATKFQLFGGIPLNGSFAWLTSDAAIGILALATVLEIAADKIPSIDHALDVFGTFMRPAAGALAAASVINGADPTTAAVLGLVLGAPMAFGFHTAKAGTRAASSATTFGLANPVLSVIEDVLAIFLTLVAFVTPLLVPVFLLMAVWLLVRIIKFARARLAAKKTVPNAVAT